MMTLPVIRSLLKLFELPDLELSPQHAQSLRHTPTLASIGALQSLPVPQTFWAPYRDDEVEVDLEPHPDPECFRRYKCPETGRWISVSEPDVRAYTVDLAWLANFVGRAITPGFTLGRTLIQRILMHLGPHQIGDGMVDVLLCRRFDHNYVSIGGVLQAGRFRQPTLILTTGSITQRLAASVGYFVTLSLADCLLEESGNQIRLDLDFTAQALGIPRSALVAAEEVYFNPASGELRLPGKPVTYFTGDQQVAVIDQLYKAWLQKSPDVKASELLKTAKTATPSIPQLFSGRSDWKIYIATPKRGWYRLNV